MGGSHDDVIKWKHFPRNWPFVRGIHRPPVKSPHKGQWHRALMFSLICTRINGWVNNGEAGDLRRHRAHYDVTVMTSALRGDPVCVVSFFMTYMWVHTEDANMHTSCYEMYVFVTFRHCFRQESFLDGRPTLWGRLCRFRFAGPSILACPRVPRETLERYQSLKE